jgi:hypothetical protein
MEENLNRKKIGGLIKKTYDQLVNERRPLEKVWKDAYRYTFPLKGQYLVNYSEDGISNAVNAGADQSSLFDSTASESVSLLAASIMSGLTPNANQWFNFKIPGVKFDDLPFEVRSWIETAAKQLFNLIHNNSNFNAVGIECFEEMAIVGMFGLYISKEPGENFVFELWPLDTLYVQENAKTGVINQTYRLMSLTAAQAEANFGFDNLPDYIKSVLNNNQDDVRKFEFIHCIRPRDKRVKFAKLTKDLPFASVYVDRKTGLVVKESGYNEFPVVIPRWTKLPRTAYAVGPVNKALPDIKTLNKVVEMMLMNEEMAIAGTYVAKADGYLNPNSIKIGARKVIFAQDPKNIIPLSSGGDFRIAFEEIVRLQRQIKSVMMADELEPIQKNYASATEVAQRTQIVRQILAPTFARLNSEFLESFLNRTFQLALRDGSIIPPPPLLANVELVPEYSTSMARAQKMEEVTAMTQFEQSLGATAQFNPSVLDIYDFDAATLRKAHLLGVPSDVIRSKEQVKRKRYEEQKAAEAAKQQQMQEQMVQDPQMMRVGLDAAGGAEGLQKLMGNQQ